MHEQIFVEPPPWTDLWDALDEQRWCLFASVAGQVRAYRLCPSPSGLFPVESIVRNDAPYERIIIPTGSGPHSRDLAIEALRKAGLEWPPPARSVDDDGCWDHWTEVWAREDGETGRMYEPHIAAWQTFYPVPYQRPTAVLMAVDGRLDLARLKSLRNHLDIRIQQIEAGMARPPTEPGDGQ